MTRSTTILMGHGSGGRLTSELIRRRFLPHLDNPYLAVLSDSAVLPELPRGRIAMSTDAFVVDPQEFSGGNVGRIAVCGTVNDVAMAGARPLYLTLAVIIEEGTSADFVERCATSAAEAAEEAGVKVVAGDTKVVARGAGDGMFVITAGIGVVPPGRLVGDERLEVGDAIVCSGPLGDHGATIMAARHQLDSATLSSDAAPVNHAVEALFAAGLDIRSLHDPTRGGLKSVTNEVAERSGLRLLLEESEIPIRPETAAVCELLGLDPLGLACEGRFLAWLPADQAPTAVAILTKLDPECGAAIIGTVEAAAPDRAPVVVKTATGGRRPLDLLSGTDLPRIC